MLPEEDVMRSASPLVGLCVVAGEDIMRSVGPYIVESCVAARYWDHL